jgi:hypothetical protein
MAAATKTIEPKKMKLNTVPEFDDAYKTQTTMATFGNIIDVIDLTADSEDDAPMEDSETEAPMEDSETEDDAPMEDSETEDDAPPPMKRIKILALRRVELQFQYDDSSVRPIRVTFALVA